MSDTVGALSVIEVDGIVAATSPGQEADTRAALGSADAKIDSPTPREAPKPTESVSEPADTGDDTQATAAVAATPDKKNGKPRHDPTARMLEATRQTARERERADNLQRELDALKAQRSQPPSAAQETRAPQPVVQQGEKFPTYDEYLTKNPEATWDDWNDAKIDWKAEQKLKAYQQAQQDEREQAQLRETWTGHAERLERAKTEKYPDFDQVVAQANTLYAEHGIQQFPPAMQDAIIGSDQSDDLLYFLGTHPDEGVLLARRFANRPVTDAELVRDILELKVAATAGARTGSALARPTTRAAAPPNPVGSSAPAPSVNGLGSLDPDQHIEAYRKSEAARRRR